MTTDDAATSATPPPDEESTSSEVLEGGSSGGRGLLQILGDLWRPKTAQSASAGSQSPNKEIVNGLDHRERLLGLAGTALALILTATNYYATHHSKTLKVRQVAPTLLVIGLILTALMLIGVILRRRALLAFASFMTGMEVITGGNVIGVLVLGFGAWLIMRVMKRQKLEQPRRSRGSPAKAPAPVKGSRVTAPPPKASKRYTPPRRRPAVAKKR